MVKDLKEYPGTVYDPILNEFVSDLVNDQGVEIERMNGIAVNLSEDPRSRLSPGLYDAGEAIKNLELVKSLKKPTGFYNPSNPKAKGIKKLEDEEKDKAEKDSVLTARYLWNFVSGMSTKHKLQTAA